MASTTELELDGLRFWLEEMAGPDGTYLRLKSRDGDGPSLVECTIHKSGRILLTEGGNMEARLRETA